MKCPRLKHIRPIAAGGEEAFFGDCIQEECAWWDDSDGYCCIIDIASSLSIIMHSLASITEHGIPKRGGK